MAEEEVNGFAEPEKGASEAKGPEDPLALRDKKIAELTDSLKRLQAEFENYKKRVDREGGERVKAANQRLVSDILPILDSFDKALEDAKSSGDAESLKAGLKGLHKQLLQTLQREGLKEIRTDGKFDPFLHEAMLREERNDVADGKITEVYQKGYTLSQKTIRPARVKVACRKCEEEPEAKTPENDNQPDDQIKVDEVQQKR